jgi:homoserine dehydrogenase
MDAAVEAIGARRVRIGLAGCGVVGTGILQLLQDNASTIEARLGAPIDVVGIAVRDRGKARDPVVPEGLVTDDPLALARHEDVDIVVEVMGGVDLAGRVVREALEQGKHVVTANKALIAEEGEALLEMAEARRVDLYFEAAVAGGIPIIRVLREALASDRIVALRGIVNGTSNYILSQMQSEGMEFAQALAEAQARGYAEADPTLDVNGGDACHKLAILATLAYGARVHPRQIHTEGIDVVTATDIAFAARFGYVIKPLAVARPTPGGALDLRVHPALVPESSVLSSIHGALNAVHLEGAMLGPCLMSGPGAGALPTAMSVVSDIVDVGRNLIMGTHARVLTRAFRGTSLREWPVQAPADQVSRFYLRFGVHDRTGVLGRIAGVLGAFDVSIEQMVQEGGGKRGGPHATIVMTTHEARLGDLKASLEEIDRLRYTTAPSCALRIEET